MLRLHALTLLAATVMVAAEPAPKPAEFLNPNAVDFHAVVPPPPPPGGIVDRAERELMRHVLAVRTPDQEAIAKYYDELDVFKMLAPVLGDWCTAANLPKTAAVFRQAYTEARPTVNAAKESWSRLRPYNADPSLKAVGDKSTTTSYPSGHGAASALFAVLLTAVAPEHTADWQHQAEMVRWSRIIGGAHYPSDTVAGQVLGEALAREMLKSPRLQQALEEVRAELASHQQKKAA